MSIDEIAALQIEFQRAKAAYRETPTKENEEAMNTAFFRVHGALFPVEEVGGQGTDCPTLEDGE